MTVASARRLPRGTIRLPVSCAPEILFELFADEPYSFLLDSALADPRLGRYTFLGSRPFLVFTARGRSYTIRERPHPAWLGPRGAMGSAAGWPITQRGRGDPLEAIKRLLALYHQEPHGNAPPFLAGAVGFVSYEAGRLLEKLRQPRAPANQLPDMCFAFYESVVGYDLQRNEVCLVSTGLRGPSGSLERMQATRAQELQARIGAVQTLLRRRPARSRFRLTSPLLPNMSRERYLQSVESVKDLIARGEIYQANFTQRFAARCAGDPYELYHRLRSASPAPFAAYLNFGPIRVLSSSPERLLRVSGSRVETRPIKGTRPRGLTADLDKRGALALVKSPKDMAEHVMIVDLERNDLGRVCEPGSVVVRELAALEVYPQVFHLTSTVEGRLRRGLTVVDTLRAVFPGGSITGAPKIRAQEVLASLEPQPRGLYTGALGYMGFSGTCDLSIVIRTLTVTGRNLSFGVGGGIVADSDAALEYEESLHKAQGMLRALGAAPAAPATASRAKVS